jgi:hypothetical protein
MIYELLDIGAYHHIFRHTEPWWYYCWKPTDYENDAEIIMVRPCLPVAILTSCRIIYQEAAPLLARKLRELHKIPIRFFLGYGAAPCITQGRLSECLDRPNRPLWNDTSPQVKSFMARCSTYLAHTRRLPRNEKSGFGVKFIITTDNGRPGLHNIEPAIMAMHERAKSTILAFSFTIKGDFPTVTISVGDQSAVFGGNMALSVLKWKMRLDEPTFDFALKFFKMSGEDWEIALNRVVAKTRASADRHYTTAEGSRK